MTKETEIGAAKALEIVERIKPLMAGHSPQIQGAVLAELLSMWLAGHPKEMHDTLLEMHLEHMKPLLALNIRILRGK